MKKRFYICYFATVGTLLGFAVALSANLILLAIIFGICFGVCLVWFCKITENGERWSYKQIRKQSGILNDIENDIRIIRLELEGKVDKQMDIDKSNVHPGIHPSITYLNMVAEREGQDDNSAENQATS